MLEASLLALAAVVSTPQLVRVKITAPGPGSGLVASVESWLPAKGPPARFVADTFGQWSADRKAEGFILLLGSADGIFYAALGNLCSDAADATECVELDMVRLHPDGASERFPLISAQSKTEGVSLREYSLAKLWTLLANRGWPLNRLKPPLSVELTDYDPDRQESEDAGGWTVRVSTGKERRYDFEFYVVRQVACWYEYGWRFSSFRVKDRPSERALAAPAPAR